ncbi:MAG TPA: alpha/beta fold hydrolase [Pyrinomonadaceae bacterium]|nr:alpha/beta fold hydrolase [Pyrinomonadaceae bacterium]
MRKLLIACVIAVIVVPLAGAWIAGGQLTAPAAATIGNPPPDLNAQPVKFASTSGSTIHGWFIPGQKNAGAIVLMHGVRANRLSMVDRARFLSHAGYSVLLFDFQAHGESEGQQITMGYLESRDAQAAVEFLKTNAPQENIGVIGVSMGGAATLLASPPLPVKAMVLESVYPTIEEAIGDRLALRLGGWASHLTPALSLQLKPRLGISAAALRPIDHVNSIEAAKLFIAGAADKHTTEAESQRMFAAASGPKEFWLVNGAGHVDVHRLAREEYEQRVLTFFARYLRQQ